MSHQHTSIVLLVMSASLLLGASVLADDHEVAADSRQAESATKQLDLRTPDITKLYTPEQLASLLDNIEGVEVEGHRESAASVPATPEIWGGIAAPLWALLHPTQAWRIFAPLPPEQTQDMDAPEAASVDREPVIPSR